MDERYSPFGESPEAAGSTRMAQRERMFSSVIRNSDNPGVPKRSEPLSEVSCRHRGFGGSAPLCCRTSKERNERKKLLAALAPAALVALPFAAPAAMAQDGETYQAELAALNGSGG
jgi:hypothetical protein